MTRTPILIVVGALLIVIVSVIFYIMRPTLESSHQISTSDASASKGSITIGVDNYIGYYILCSSHMHERMLSDGWKRDCKVDKANYAERFAALRDGKLNFAVATVDTYVLLGQQSNYSGVVAFVIDESKGADGIVARNTVAKSLTDLRNRRNVKVAFTPDSPSHYLLKAVGRDFDVPLFRSEEKAWQIHANGSSDALARLEKGEADVAVLWEPDISKALSKPGIVKLLGSEKTSNLIVDILLVNRDYYEAHPDVVRVVLNNYVKALKYYRDNEDVLIRESAAYAGVTEEAAAHMLKGVAWANLQENAAKWFGLTRVAGQAPTYGLITTIDKTVRTLIDVGDISDNPLPGGDPRSIINSSQLVILNEQGVNPGSVVDAAATEDVASNPLAADFTALDASAWDRLKEVGMLKVRPILFVSGVSQLSDEDKEQLGLAAEALKSYPYFRIEVHGHTKPGGDEAESKLLSEERADAVARYLMVTYGLDEDRVRALGFGATKPLAQVPGESWRERQDKLARVEIHLKTEEY